MHFAHGKGEINPLKHWIGWSTLSYIDVLRSITKGLRLYSRNSQWHKITSRRKLHDTDHPALEWCEWKIRSHGKLIGYISIKQISALVHANGTIALARELESIRLWSNTPKEKRGKRPKHIKNEELLEEIHKYVKNQIDVDCLVGTQWYVRGLPHSRKKRQEWIDIYELVQEYRKERRLDGEPSKPSIQDTLDHLKYETDAPLVKKTTLKQIIKKGDGGFLDNCLPEPIHT